MTAGTLTPRPAARPAPARRAARGRLPRARTGLRRPVDYEKTAETR